jgi:tetratricopeptide (TPR) repeat protein
MSHRQSLLTIIPCFALWLTAVLPAACAGPDAALEHANQLRMSGKFQQAADCYAEMAKANPKNAIYWSKLAECYDLLGKADQAISACGKALELDPKCPWAYDLRANAYMRKNNPKAALADANKEVELNPKSPGALIARAAIYQTLNEPRRAMADSDKAISVAPNDAGAYLGRAQRLSIAGNNAKAILDCKSALRLYPKYWDAFTLVIQTYCRLNQRDRAMAEIQRAQDQKLFEPIALATLCFENGLWAPAIALYDKAAPKLGDLEAVHIAKAASYLQLGQFSSGAREASAAIKLNAKNARAFLMRGRCEAGLTDFKSAMFDLNQSIMLEPESGATYYERGKLYVQQGLWQEGLEDFTSSIKLRFVDPDAYVKRGECHFGLKEYAAALKDADTALAKDHNCIAAMHVRVWVELQQNQIQQATSEAQKVLKLAPKSGASWALMARVYGATGDQKARVEALKKQVELDPNNAQAKVALSDAQTGKSSKTKHHHDSSYQNYKLGLPRLDEEVKNHPTAPAAYMSRAEYYKKVFEPAAAVSDYSQAIKLDPDLQAAYVLRGECYMQMEKWQLARADFAQACQLIPTDLVAVRRLGLIDQTLGSDDKAVTDYSNYLALRKNNRIYIERAKVLCHQGKLKEALFDASNAIECAPHNLLGYSVRGDIEMSAHDYNKAIADYSEAIKIKGGDAELFRKRAAAYDRLGNKRMRDLDLAASGKATKDIFDDAPFRTKSPGK